MKTVAFTYHKAMRLEFTKMHGLGNDFIVLDNRDGHIPLRRALVRKLADRKFGIGCDQLLVVENAVEQADFRYRIFNADGDEVEQCGNGARCFARYVREQGLIDGGTIRVETLSGELELNLLDHDQVRVNMGEPRLEPVDIPFIADSRAITYTLEVGADEFSVSAVSMGNPHCVIAVEDVDKAPVASLGEIIESHSRFPKRVNVGFMQVVDRGHIRLRVFERGVGETRACGSGACAAVVAGRIQNLLDSEVEVELLGGKLSISWAGEGQTVNMIGTATRVFDGSIEI